MTHPSQKEYKQMEAIGKRADKMAKSYFDYSPKEKKEIMDKANKESSKIMQETIRKGTPPAKEEWEIAFRRRWGNIDIYDVLFSKTAFYDGIVEFIRFTRSQAYEEGRREAIEEAKDIFKTYKEEPMTGNVVLMELNVLLNSLKEK